MELKQLTKDDVTFSLSIEDEETTVRGNAMASGDEAADRACEAEIAARLNQGDTWAWCTVVVTATYESEGEVFSEEATLGCCSYANEAEFRTGGYYDDMCDEALDSLNDELARVWKALPKWQS